VHVHAALGVATLVANVAHAQSSLDIYGRLDVGLVTPSKRVDSHNQTVTPEPLLLTSGSRNRVGLRATYDSADAWRMRLTLEQSLLGLNGEKLFDDAYWRNLKFADAVAMGTVSHYAWGRLDVGRRTDVAKDGADASHPWGSETVGSDRCASILRWPCPSHLDRPTGITVETPWIQERLKLFGQATRFDEEKVFAARAVYSDGARRVDVAFRRSSTGAWLMPVGLIEPVGAWRLHLLATVGRLRDSESGTPLQGNYLFVGATRGWRGGEVRIGAGRYRLKPADDHSHWSVGYHVPLRPDLVVYTDAALHNGREGTSGGQIDVGFKLTI